MRDIILHRKNRFIWALLAFQGGYINTGGFLTIHLYVSHVTGFSAKFSTELVGQNFLKAFYFSLVPAFFLLGSYLTAFVAERRKRDQRDAVYVDILLVICLIFTVITVLGYLNYFGPFGNTFATFKHFVLLSLLAFACGTQNAMFTHFSGSVVRTTHLTGLTTDLGIGLAKLTIGKNDEEKKMNKIRIILILSFIIGSIGGILVFQRINYLGFILPVIISFFVGGRLFSTRRNISKSVKVNENE